jgi:endonuclease/exonuclease/phosphatase family metal-dependent hydrolase
VSLLVRTWNLFHGNAVPPERRGFLEEMVGLVTADGPDVVSLQEVPVWALRHLEDWSGMAAVAAVAARPRLRSAALGRLVTELHHGLFRSALTGQANAILLARTLSPGEQRSLAVSSGGERRVCLAVRVEGVGLVAGFHVTGGAVADEQLRSVAAFAVRLAKPGEPVVLAGDANIRPGHGRAYGELKASGFSEPLAGSIDQIVVRGATASAPEAWPAERRRAGGRLLSDHAPVELRVG